MIAILPAILGLGLGMQAAPAQGGAPPRKGASVKPSQAPPPFVLTVKGGIEGTADILAKQVETRVILDRLKADLKIPIASSALVAQNKVDLSLQGSSVIQLLLALAPVVLADIEVGASPEDAVWKRIHLIGYNEKEPARELKPTGFLLAAGTVNEDGTITLPDPDAEDQLTAKAMREESGGDAPMLAVIVKDGRVSLKARKQPLVALLNEVAKRGTIPFDLRGQPDMFPLDIDLADLPLRDLPVALGRPGVRLIVRRNLATGEEFVQGILVGEKGATATSPRD